MKRYLERFRKINDGIIHDRGSQNYDDDVYAFFQNCYHLKDWIKNDPDCEARSNVEHFINQNRNLSICADLCNALKHLSLTSSRSRENPNFGGNHTNLFLGEENPTISVKYNISTTFGDIDAFELAEKCILAWEKYIDDNIN